MTPPVRPPVAPMLARLARELPGDGHLFEPKWDGFRCLAFRNGDEVHLRSRHDRPLARYFPEVVAGLRTLAGAGLVLDGELMIRSPHGADFSALLARLHPAASRVERLSRETPAVFVAFDVLAVGGRDLRPRPFGERRAELERALAHAAPPVLLTPATRDRRVADRWLDRFAGGGVDGVVAKRLDEPYREGARAMVKAKRERTADCVVAGFRLHSDRPLPSALLLGLYDEAGCLRHVGVAASFGEKLRHALLGVLRPLVAPLEGHPWEHGFLVEGSPVGRLRGAAGRWTPDMVRDWIPVVPSAVCEVAYDHVDGDRFRHPARFRRWRPDRDPGSCLLRQLESDADAAGPLLAA